MAAGMAAEGFRPVCAIYSTFLQRGFDQVVHDVCIQNLPVIFALDRSGAVGNDGETHQGLYDIAYLRSIPNITLMSPKDENELTAMIHTALAHEGPVAIRFPRGTGQGTVIESPPQLIPHGSAEVLKQGQDVLLLCYGAMTNCGLNVAQELKARGVTTTVVNARYAKPLDTELLGQQMKGHKLVCTLEDHAIQGGFGSAVLEACHDLNFDVTKRILRFGFPDTLVSHASQKEQHEIYGLDSAAIVTAISEELLLAPTNAAVVS